jgi:L-rhamnose mutarotase
MQRVGFMLKVKPEMIEEYKRRHKAVWPEMLDALRQTGWHNYSIFMHNDGTLFFYVETPNFQAALDGMARREVNARWQDYMKDLFEATGGKHADQSFIMLEEVFHLD